MKTTLLTGLSLALMLASTAGAGEGHACGRCRAPVAAPAEVAGRAVAAAGVGGVGGVGGAGGVEGVRGPDPRIHPRTGADKRIWPPDRPFDHIHLKLELTVPDMAEDRFTARETLTMTPIGVPRRVVPLMAGPGLKINRITAAASGDEDGRRATEWPGGEATFTRDGDSLQVLLPADVEPGRLIDVTIDYETDGPGGGGGGGAGLTWSPDDPDTDIFDPMYHAQGQAESNRLWLPSHDFPNERLTSELIVNVPDGFQAISNGKLVSSQTGGEGASFHWLQDHPHVPYLITLIIGKFDVVEVGGPDSARPGIAMPVYGPVGSAETLRRRFADTPHMMVMFEEYFGEPYPWAKYAQVFVRDFAAGAMENTSATTFNISYLDDDEDSWDLQSIIAHELAHQWMGDLVTCRSWEHLWLNEGWATFCEALWAERKATLDGKSEEAARRAYLDVIRDYATAELAVSRLALPDHLPMANSIYANPDDRFGGPNDVYAKGCMVLHMLRETLGDDLFWQGVRLYLDRHKDDGRGTRGLVETSDFRRAMEDATGRSLERFFEQWVYRPSHPQLTVDLVWREGEGPEAGLLRAVVVQTQTIDGANPAFAFSLPISIELPESAAVGEGSRRTHDWVIHIDERITTATLPLPARPERVRVNEDDAVLAQIELMGDWPRERRRRFQPGPAEAEEPAEEQPAEAGAASHAPAAGG